jgi:O-antigen/teichoic acid export membrane protein
LASLVSIFAFGANVVFNLVLIPRFGILGASAASLVSYTLSSIVYSVVAARLTGQMARDFWVPRREDVRFAAKTAFSLVRRIARVDRAA